MIKDDLKKEKFSQIALIRNADKCGLGNGHAFGTRGNGGNGRWQDARE
jgi:hypothetical protein